MKKQVFSNWQLEGFFTKPYTQAFWEFHAYGAKTVVISVLQRGRLCQSAYLKQLKSNSTLNQQIIYPLEQEIRWLQSLNTVWPSAGFF